MKIKNINGISRNTCTCGSWLDHWKKFSHQSITYCAVNTCVQKDIVGALVQRDDPKDNGWYVIPLCKKHSDAKGQSLEVGVVYRIVTANVAETCGKQ